ncbi:MAG: hypothetical protein WBB08_04265 [Halobacteriota archaeon]
MNKKEGKKIAVMTAVIMGFMMFAFMPLASAGVTSFTVTPNTGIAGAVQSYDAYVITDGVTSINITIPAGFIAVAPATDGVEIARLDFFNSSTKAYYGHAIITANDTSSTPNTVDIYWELGGDAITTTQDVDYAAGATNRFESGFGDGSFAILELPEALGGSDGSIEIRINSTAFLLDAVMTSIKQFVRNPLTAGDYVFFAEGVTETVTITAPGYYGGGVYRNGNWILSNSITTPSVDHNLWWGWATDIPVTGDWDGDGTDTIGVYRSGQWILSNSITTPSIDYIFSWGWTNDIPLTGDWNGDGSDTIGVHRNGNWILSNSITTPSVDQNFWWGWSTDEPITSDWNNDGKDTIGVYRNGNWVLSNSITTPSVDHNLWWGWATDEPVTGHWS